MEPASLRAELERARTHTDGLFRLVADATLAERPIADRHRLIFYLGHLDAFDWNQVARGALGARSFHPDFDRLFEAGIDPPPGQAPQDRPSDWPAVDEVRSYVRRVREKLDALWDAAPADRRQVALEHRWMHAETLCYLLHRLPHALKRPPAPPAPAAPETAEGPGIRTLRSRPAARASDSTRTPLAGTTSSLRSTSTSPPLQSVVTR